MFAYTGVTLTTRTVSFLGTVSEAVRIRSNTHPDIRDKLAVGSGDTRRFRYRVLKCRDGFVIILKASVMRAQRIIRPGGALGGFGGNGLNLALDFAPLARPDMALDKPAAYAFCLFVRQLMF